MGKSLHLTSDENLVKNYLELFREFDNLQLYQKAEATLQMALEKAPNHPDLLQQLANLYLKLDIPDRALSVANKLVRHHPMLSSGYQLRAEIWENLGDTWKAMTDYERALSHSKSDIPLVQRILEIKLHYGQSHGALELIGIYKDLISNPFIFTADEAEAHFQSGNIAVAFMKLREALSNNIDDPELLKQYLRFAIHHGKKPPKDVLEVLRSTLPGLNGLEERDLAKLETDFYRHHHQPDVALKIVDSLLADGVENFYWEKIRAFIQLEMGKVDESVAAFRELFFQNPLDAEVRGVLENYFIMQEQLDQWKRLVQQVLKDHPEQVELFRYLRTIAYNKDWLAICELEYEDFMSQLHKMNLSASSINDVTYEKLPGYAFEIFIGQLAIHNNIPEVSQVWNLILQERQKKQQIPPFQLEDLQATYPVWIFVLHIYFLFKQYAQHPFVFTPRRFQTDCVAGVLLIDETPVEIDVSLLLGNKNRRVKPLVKAAKGFRWRWRSNIVTPEILLHDIPFFSAPQFQIVLQDIQDCIHDERSDLAIELIIQ